VSHVSLVVKATRLCNLRCSYCNDWRVGPDQTMSFEVLAHLTAKALSDPTHRLVEICWHGGEPTVLPISWFRRALVVQSRFRGRGQRIRNSIQSNGTRLTADWARFLRESQFDVSISLDGPKDVHDRFRVYASGKPSFDDIAHNVRLLRAHGVPVGVLMVVDEASIAAGPKRLFEFMVEFGAERYGLLAAMPRAQRHAQPITPAEHYVEPSRMTKFLAGLYDCWLANGDAKIRIREIDDLRHRLSGTGRVTCTLAGGCIGHLYSIEPNGDVNHCDEFIGDERYVVGNIVRQDFRQIRAGSKIRELEDENRRALRRMQSCPQFAVCNGWCPHERYMGTRHDSNYRPECCGLRPLIEHMKERALTSEGGRVRSNSRRRGSRLLVQR
jgi:uncharacterized protein